MSTVPNPGRYGKIDVEDVRAFLWDRTIEDNSVELDLVFSDEEIKKAMRFAAMKYSETPPFINQPMTPDALPYGMMFLNGIAYFLYLQKLQTETRVDFEYNSGNMSIDLHKRRIAHLQNFVKLFKDDFESMIKDRKVSINVHGFFASY